MNDSNIQLLSASEIIALVESGIYGNFMKKAGKRSLEQLALALHHKEPHLPELLELLDLYRRAEKKIPSLLRCQPVLNRKALEQCTSELVANFRAARIGRGGRLLNLSGGLGIDDMAFSPHFNEVISLDSDAELNEMFRYNCSKAGISNVKRLDQSAESYLQAVKTDDFDVIYADPDRQSGGHKADVGRHQPDVFALFNKILSAARSFELKLSPLYDVGQIASEFRFVKEVHCVSLAAEMKEVWVSFERDFLPADLVSREAVMISKKGEVKTYHDSGFVQAEEKVEPGKFVFLSDASMMHSRLSFNLAHSSRMKCMSIRGHVFTSDHLPEQWYGKIYEHRHTSVFKWRQVKRYLKDHGIRQARILISGSRLKPGQLFAELRIKEGGEDYLLLFNSGGKDYLSHLRLQ